MKLTKKIVSLFILGLLLLPVAGRMVQAVETPESVSINFTGVFDDNNSSINFQSSANYGANFSLAAPSRSSYSFAYWIVNGVVRYDLEETSSIKVTSNMNLSAVYSPDGKNTVLFIDSNGEILGTYFVTSGQTVASPSLVSHVGKPGLIVKTEDTWKTPQGTVYSSELIIESNTVFILQYEVENQENTFSVTVNNGSGSGTYVYNQLVTVSANPVDFSHWEENGIEVSRLLNYSFTVVSNRTLTAVSQATPEADLPIVTMTDDLELRSGYHTYMGQFYLPSGYELVEYGFLLSDTLGTITRSTSGVIVAQNNQRQAQTNEFVMSFPTSSHRTARAYVVYKFGETVTTAYSVNTEQYADKYVVTFDSNGGTQPYSQSIYTNQKATSPISTKDNYVLFGWFEDEELTTLFDFDTNITSNLTLYAKWETLIVEGFSTAFASAESGYTTTVNFTSSGFDWSAKAARTLSGIDGNSFILGNSADNNYIEVLSTSGISSFSVELVRAFTNTNTRTVQLFINDVSYGSFSVSTTSDTVQIFTVNNINISGNTIIRLVGTSPGSRGSIIVDNFSWSYYTPNLTDQQKIDLDKASLQLPQSIKQSTTLDLPTLGANGSTISWELLDDYPNINILTGAVTYIPSDPTYTAVIIATLSSGLVEDTKEFEVVIGKTPTERVTEDLNAIVLVEDVYELGQITLPSSGVNGTDVTWESSNTDYITNIGEIILLGDVTITLTASVSYLSSNDQTKQFIIVIHSSVPDPETFTETFSTDIGNSYIDGSFNGVNNTVWNFIHSRNVDTYPIDGLGILLRYGDSSLSTTLSGGVKSFSVDFRKAYTGTSVRQIIVTFKDSNNVEKSYTSVTFGTISGTESTVYTLSANDVNMSGAINVTIKLNYTGTTNKQTVVDNFVWTTNP